MTIEELSPDDYETIVDLWNRAGMKAKLKGRDRPGSIKKQILSGTVFILGDVQRGRLRGVVIVSSDGRKGWINRLAVLPEFREHGIASALVREAERRLRKMGIEIFAAHIEEENSTSKELFEELGYTPARDIIYYVKRLRDDV